MSSYPILDYMLKLRIHGERITIYYTCPRCGCAQSASIHPGDLLFGVDLKCRNTDVCGEDNMGAEIVIRMTIGHYIGLADVPLNEPDHN